MNPSRIDPAAVAMSLNNYLIIPGTMNEYVTFVMCIMVTDSSLHDTREVFKEPRKLISGIPHICEAPRMISTINSAMGISTAHIQIYQNAITFISGRSGMGNNNFGNFMLRFFNMMFFAYSILFTGSSSSPVKNPSRMFASPGSTTIAEPESVFVKSRSMISPDRKG